MEEKKNKNVSKTSKKGTKKAVASSTQAKKTSQTKTVQNKKTAPKKTKTTTQTGKKTTSPKEIKPKENVPTKKVETKKNVTKKEVVKKKIVKEVPKTQEDKLEKKIIFDGTESKNIADVVNKLEEDNIILEDKVVKRSKARKITIYILILLIIGIIVATTTYVVKEQINIKENKQTLNSNVYKKVSRKYKTINDIKKENNPNKENKDEIKYSNIETITLSTFEEKALKKEDMTVLIASTTCYHCITFEPIVNEVFKNADKKIYRIDIISLTDEEITRFRTYYSFTIAPTIFTIKNGIVTSEASGTMTKDELTTWVSNNA